MNVFLDTNILLDYLLDREEHAEYALQLLLLGNAGVVNLCVADLSISNISYITRGDIDKAEFFRVMKKLSGCYRIVSVGADAINKALDAQWSDFEDSLQYFAAINAKADIIITRNVKDFAQSQIPVMTAIEFLTSIEGTTKI